MDFQTKISKIITFVFHPLLMPTYGLILMFSSKTYLSFFPLNAKLIIFGIIFTGTFVFPMILMPFFIYKKYIKKLEMYTKKERILPLIVTFVSYYGTYYAISQLPLPVIFNKYLLASTLTVALSLIVTIYWKISLHLIGIGGLLALIASMSFKFTADFRLYFIAIILISGIIAFARLKLKSHSPIQIYTGFFAGFLVVFTIMLSF
jgi:hypothetical protein